MTWFAVPNDEVGGWAVANRQVPTSGLNQYCATCTCAAWYCECAEFVPVDVVIADGVKSQEYARRIAALLNYQERRCKTSNTWANWIIAKYSAPWPEAKEEA